MFDGFRDEFPTFEFSLADVQVTEVAEFRLVCRRVAAPHADHQVLGVSLHSSIGLRVISIIFLAFSLVVVLGCL